jgi:hypothetical protein
VLLDIGQGTGLIVAGKCGTTSIKSALSLARRPQEVVTSEELLERSSTRVIFLRQPHERLVSAYRMLVRKMLPVPFSKISFQHFAIDVCQNPHGDKHTAPQTADCYHEGTFLPTRVIRWDFDELAEVIGVAWIDHQNRNKPDAIWINWTDAILEAFDRAFADDLALWSARLTVAGVGPGKALGAARGQGCGWGYLRRNTMAGSAGRRSS